MLRAHRADTAAVLADVAAAAIAVLAVLADRDLVLKECGCESCTRLYVDRSRGPAALGVAWTSAGVG